MKKIILFLSIALVSGLLLSSCTSGSNATSKGTLLGLWQCTNISSSVAGKNVNGLSDNKYLKLFTIGFAGINSGVYARVGQSGNGAASDLSAVATAASSLYAGTGKVSDWKKFNMFFEEKHTDRRRSQRCACASEHALIWMRRRICLQERDMHFLLATKLILFFRIS